MKRRLLLAAVAGATAAILAISPGSVKHGLGASLTDKVDAVDIGVVYKAKGKKPTVDGLPTSYTVPAPLPPVLDQHDSPMCVAFSASALRTYEEYFDYKKSFNFDESAFFAMIGGTSNGALVSTSLSVQQSKGYPVYLAGNASAHRIASYASVASTQGAIMAALVDWKTPLQARSSWFSSWFTPVNGVLPKPDTLVGGHAWIAEGYTSVGIILHNSWGADWSNNGRAIMPWAYATKYASFWVVTDQINNPTPAPTASPRPSATATPAPRPTPTSSPTLSASPSPFPSPSPSPTLSPSPTASPSPTPALTVSPTASVTPAPSSAPVGPVPGSPIDKGRFALVVAALGIAVMVLAWAGRHHPED